MSETSAVAGPLHKKILIVRLGAMGDIIHAIPAVVMLRWNFADAEIGWVVENRWAELFGPLPFVNRLHRVDTRRWRKQLVKSRSEIISAIREIQAVKYDIVVDFQGAIKSALISAVSRAPRRYGFADPWEKPASLLYTGTAISSAVHVVQRNGSLAEKVISHEGRHLLNDNGCFVYVPIRDLEQWADTKVGELRLDGRFAILNPGAGWGAKQWPVERYAEVARALGAEGIRSLVNYGPGEEELARAVERQSDGHAVAASFSISQLMAITRKAALFIGGDTGPMHLAAFLQVPVVALFGPTDPTRTGPLGTKNIVLRDPASVTSHKRSRETEAGLRNITTGQVLQAARELLQNKQTGVRV